MTELNKNPFEAFSQTGNPLADKETQQYEINLKQNPELVLYNSLAQNEQSEALKLAETIKHNQYDSILMFGKEAQEKLSQFTSYMLKHTQKQDIQMTGQLLNDMFMHIEKINPDAFMPPKQNFISRIFQKRQPNIQEVMSDYTRLKVRIDRLSIQLEHSQIQLLKDNDLMEKLYKMNESYFRHINTYIAACEWKIYELKTELLPKLQHTAATSLDPLDEQAVRDLHMQIEWIDKRKYDLEISREIAIQSAPQIRMIQQTGQLLIEKIQSSILTTIPIWQNQIAIILQMNKHRRIAETEQKMIRATDALSRKNYDMYKATKSKTNNQIEHTSMDLQQFKETQMKLLRDLEETITIQQKATKSIQ